MKDGGHKSIYSLRVADIAVVAGIAIIAACLFSYFALHDAGSKDTEGKVLTITVDGDVIGSYSLDGDRVIEIGDSNVCEIHDGEAYMKSADCPDQSCVHSMPIDSNGEVIVCLPNRVVLEVTYDGDDDDNDNDKDNYNGVDTVAF